MPETEFGVIAHLWHVLDDGCIVERGTHHPLLARAGTYAALGSASFGPPPIASPKSRSRVKRKRPRSFSRAALFR